MRQEKGESRRTQLFVDHSDNNELILNLHSLHNHAEVLRFLSSIDFEIPPVLAPGEAAELREGAGRRASKEHAAQKAKQLAKNANTAQGADVEVQPTEAVEAVNATESTETVKATELTETTVQRAPKRQRKR